VHNDRYTEEASAARALRVNRLGVRSDEVVLGALSLRRFVMAYSFDNGTLLLASAPSGSGGNTNAAFGNGAEAVDASMLREIGLVVVGAALWAMWLVVMTPVFTPHVPRANTAVQQHTASAIAADSAAGPSTVSRRRPVRRVAAQSTAGDSDEDDGVTHLRIPKPRPIDEPVESAAAQQQPSVASPLLDGPTDTPEALRRQRIVSKLRAAFSAVAHARAEWPYELSTMRAAQDVTDAVVAIHLVLAIGYFDTSYALATIANASSAVGTLVLVAATVLVCALIVYARVLMRLSPRNSAHCIQLYVLLTLWLVNTPLFDWDFALVALSFYAVFASVSASLLVLHTLWPDTLSGQRHYAREALTVPLLCMWIGVVTFTALVQMRFTMQRLWEDHPNLNALAVFVTFALVTPTVAFIANREALYPLLLLERLARRIGASK
jgi:hypothetical protein